MSEIIKYKKINEEELEKTTTTVNTMRIKEKDVLVTKINLLNELEEVENQYLIGKKNIEDKLAEINNFINLMKKK